MLSNLWAGIAESVPHTGPAPLQFLEKRTDTGSLDEETTGRPGKEVRQGAGEVDVGH
jgi:hypothetical protein